MSKRNIVWITIAAVIAVLVWKFPETILLRDALYHKYGMMLEVRQQILKNYVEDVDDKQLLRDAIDGMVQGLDPYSTYLSAEEYEDFQSTTEGQFQGIGIAVEPTPNNELLIINPIEGSPAFDAGLRSGDVIVEVDGVKTADILPDETIHRIKGPPGSSVKLRIRRPSAEEPFEIEITRADITIQSVRGYARTDDWDWDYLVDKDYRIGYVRISAFERATTRQLDDIVRRLRSEQGMRALIIDVRDNGGGLMDVVIDMANLFISEGTILSRRGRTSTPPAFIATPENTYPLFATVVLVNNNTASASEILAGVLKDHGRAIIIGEQTYGKGSVQETLPIHSKTGESGVLKLTTSYYVLPGGELVQGKGITPHQVVEMTPQQRKDWMESVRAVYSPRKTASQPATATAPAEIAIMIDPQLQAALTTLRKKLTTQPSPN